MEIRKGRGEGGRNVGDGEGKNEWENESREEEN